MTMREKTKDSIELLTFGCRLNIYESEVMKTHARDAGLENTIIVNTCAVTSEAERSARQAIRRARKENPEAKIIVTGCAAQVHPEKFAEMKEVDRIIGNDLKLKAESWGLEKQDRVEVNDIMAVKETASHLISGFDDHARAFVQVQNGCDHRCTFCIIPYGRGNSRSVPIGEIVDQIKTLVEQGYHEVVLTGVDVTSYGADLPGQPSLGQMIRRLLALVPDLKRVRLSSLDPVEIDDDLWRLIETEPRLMPHLHMSLQAGDDMILKRMKRRHLRADAIEMARRAKELRPDIVFGADIIAGFPTETDEMFENSLDIIKACDLTYLHVFPYSPRPGTPAAKMPQDNASKRKERAARLRALGKEQEKALFERHIGTVAEIVTEKNNMGRSEHFIPVYLDHDISPGIVAKVRLTGLGENGMIGELIK